MVDPFSPMPLRKTEFTDVAVVLALPTGNGWPAANVDTISEWSEALTAARVMRYVSPDLAPGISPHKVTGPAYGGEGACRDRVAPRRPLAPAVSKLYRFSLRLS